MNDAFIIKKHVCYEGYGNRSCRRHGCSGHRVFNDVKKQQKSLQEERHKMHEER